MNIKNQLLPNLSFILVFLGSFFAIILNYKNSLIYYLVYFIGIFLSFILIYQSKKKLRPLLIFGITFFFLTFQFLVRYGLYEDTPLDYIFVSFINIIIGYGLALNIEKINFRIVFYTCSLSLFIFIPFFTTYGNTEYLNRTYYTLPMVLLLMSVAYKDLIEFRKPDALVIFIFFIISMLSVSRSTILFSLLSVFITLLTRNRTLVVLILPMLMLVIYQLDIFNSIASMEMVTRLQSRGIDSGRYIFWGDHISRLTVVKFFFGYSISDVTTVLSDYFSEKGHTLHSSLLHAQTFYGISGVIIFILLFYRLLNVFRYIKNIPIFEKIVYILTVLTFLSKALFDTIFFVQRYDFIFFMLLFHSNIKPSSQHKIS